MNPIVTSAVIPSTSTQINHENLEASSEAQKKEQHVKKVDKVKAEDMFKAGDVKTGAHKAGIAVTPFVLPTISTEKEMDLDAAKEYLDSEKYKKVCELTEIPNDSSFRMEIMGPDYQLFMMMMEVSNKAREDANITNAVMSGMKQKYTAALLKNIQEKGDDQLMMSVMSAVTNLAINGSGTSTLVKNSSHALKDMKSAHAVLPQQQASLGKLETKLAGLDPNSPKYSTVKSDLLGEIGAVKSSIDNSRHASRIAQIKIEQTTTVGMAVQGAAASVTGMVDGGGQSMAAANEVEIQKNQASSEMMADLRQRNVQMTDDKKALMEAALTMFRTLSDQDKDLMNSVASNIR